MEGPIQPGPLETGGFKQQKTENSYSVKFLPALASTVNIGFGARRDQ